MERVALKNFMHLGELTSKLFCMLGSAPGKKVALEHEELYYRKEQYIDSEGWSVLGDSSLYK